MKTKITIAACLLVASSVAHAGFLDQLKDAVVHGGEIEVGKDGVQVTDKKSQPMPVASGGAGTISNFDIKGVHIGDKLADIKLDEKKVHDRNINGNIYETYALSQDYSLQGKNTLTIYAHGYEPMIHRLSLQQFFNDSSCYAIAPALSKKYQLDIKADQYGAINTTVNDPRDPNTKLEIHCGNNNNMARLTVDISNKKLNMKLMNEYSEAAAQKRKNAAEEKNRQPPKAPAELSL